LPDLPMAGRSDQADPAACPNRKVEGRDLTDQTDRESEPIGFPGDEPTETQVAEHERHAALGENRWFTCPLCDDETDD
jgi:hypothetical protein